MSGSRFPISQDLSEPALVGESGPKRGAGRKLKFHLCRVYVINNGYRTSPEFQWCPLGLVQSQYRAPVLPQFRTGPLTSGGSCVTARIAPRTHRCSRVNGRQSSTSFGDTPGLCGSGISTRSALQRPWR